MFITVEGIDGAGKTTQARMLYNSISGLPLKGGVVLTNEPNDGRLSGANYNPLASNLKDMTIGQIVRSLIGTRSLDDIDLTTRLLLIYAARRKHVANVILPALKAGKIVVSDRFYDSSVAYFAYSPNVDFEVGKEIVDMLHRISLADLPGAERSFPPALPIMPDVTFWIDTPTATSAARMHERGFFDEIDSVADDSPAIRQVFQRLAEEYPKRIIRIDGDRPQNEVHRDIAGRMEALLSAGPYLGDKGSLVYAAS